MGYQPRAKAPRSTGYGSRRTLRERSREKKRLLKRPPQQFQPQKNVPTEQEISEATLKRLHTLGRQKFGSSPFNEHFDRWLTNLYAVLDEFKAFPGIGVDEQFLNECNQALDVIKLQLDDWRRKEFSVEQDIKNVAYFRSCLNQINMEYSKALMAIRSKRNRAVELITSKIDGLKGEQDKIIQTKAGLFRTVSKKAREQKEIVVVEQLSEKQRELEMVFLDFSTEKKQLQEEFDAKREPILEQMKRVQKKISDLDTDASLEARWFACESLIDAVNSFMQRKSAI